MMPIESGDDNDMINSMTFTLKEFSKVFNDYGATVYNKKATKIPYQHWRNINDLIKHASSLSSAVNCINCIEKETHNGMVDYDFETRGMRVTATVPEDFQRALITACKGEKKNVDVDDATVTYSNCTIPISGNLTTSSTIDYNNTSNYNSNAYDYTTTITTGLWTGIPKVELDSNGNLVVIDSYGHKTIISNEAFVPEPKTKEKNTMNIPSFKFDFGPAGDNVAMSPYGLAIKTPQNGWIAFNPDSNQTIDVTGLTFNFKNMIYKMPVAIEQLNEGDLILHQKLPMFVLEVDEDNSRVIAIDLAASEEKIIIPVANMFGFNYITKIAPLFNFGKMTPSADNPFGNIMPMILMSSIMDDNKSKDDNDLLQTMMMLGMLGNNNPFAAMFAGGGSNAR